ncbi:MAG: glycosyltransferase, partial [bacterium]
VTFAESLKDFPQGKAVLTGNPYRPEILEGNKEKAIKEFNLSAGRPTILILGGGTGAIEINKLVMAALPELLSFCQVIHLTGQGREISPTDSQLTGYHGYGFLNEQMPDALAIADLVITRAGFSTLTELAILAKPAIVIPMPDTHQEDNANYFAKNNAVLALNQKELTADSFTLAIKELLNDEVKKGELCRNIQKLMPLTAIDNLIKEILKFQ